MGSVAIKKAPRMSPPLISWKTGGATDLPRMREKNSEKTKTLLRYDNGSLQFTTFNLINHRTRQYQEYSTGLSKRPAGSPQQ